MVLLTLAFIHCKKDEAKPKNSYFPHSDGSAWQYTEVRNATNQEIETINESASGAATINGKTWSVIKRIFDNGSDDRYYLREEKGVYYRADSMYNIVVEHVIFKDDVKAGDTWTDSIDLGDRHKRYYTTTIKDVGLNNIEVRGKTYNDVVRFSRKYYTEGWGPGDQAYNYEFYVSKGVGIIKEPGSDYRIELTSYTIK